MAWVILEYFLKSFVLLIFETGEWAANFCKSDFLKSQVEIKKKQTLVAFFLRDIQKIIIFIDKQV